MSPSSLPRNGQLWRGRTFWYVPHGPVLDYADPRAADRLRALTIGLREVARRHGAIAVKLEPRLEADVPELAALAGRGLRRLPDTLQVGQTRIVDLVDDEALLAGFDKDTRYSVRRAEREGVVVEITVDAGETAAIDALHELVVETQRRAGFPMPPLERYRVAWRALAAAGRAAILEARHEGTLLASGMVVFEGQRSYYLFSGSRREERGEPKRYASYALQWAMMRLARDRGAGQHDLWGIAPANAGPEHAWHGVGLFKKGFGGRAVGMGRQLGPRGRPDAVPAAPGDRHRSRLGAQMTDARRMGLGALTDVVAPERVAGIPVGEVTALAYDSRRVEPGTLFFAVPGVHVDGHDYVEAAVAAGAVGAVVERELPDIAVPQLVVDRTRRALADAADAWFGRPSQQLTVIGVTGTDGKSTVTALTAEMLWDCRWHPGQIGTVSIGIFDELEPNLARSTTTPRRSSSRHSWPAWSRRATTRWSWRRPRTGWRSSGPGTAVSTSACSPP